VRVSGDADEVLFETRGRLGLITLDRPKALNALTLGMVRAMTRQLAEWAGDDRVARVAITGAGGRAFCAGGDIRLLREAVLGGRAGDALTFWREEYALNGMIRRYPKPYVALVDGIVMGGGVGVSVHGAYRVAGEGYVFAMPEVGIGFFPDVGATYVLSRLEGHAGTWLALTGSRIGPRRAVGLGLATHYVPSAAQADLLRALEGEGDTAAVLAAHSGDADPAGDGFDPDVCARCFQPDSPGEVLARLDAAAAQGSGFARDAAAAMRTKSPLSLALACAQMRLGPSLDFEEAMALEFRIAARMPGNPDFAEGIRAVLVDRDNAPRWSHSSPDGVTAAELAPWIGAPA
jgi:enoyl-CoA hydratase